MRAASAHRGGYGVARRVTFQAFGIDHREIPQAARHAVADQPVGGIEEGVAENIDALPGDLGVVAKADDCQPRRGGDRLRARRGRAEKRADDDLCPFRDRLVRRSGAALRRAAGGVDREIDGRVAQIGLGQLGRIYQAAPENLAAGVAGSERDKKRHAHRLVGIDLYPVR